ncbi:MAG: ECF-type sigma factor [Planctomycetota bacterium]
MGTSGLCIRPARQRIPTRKRCDVGHPDRPELPFLLDCVANGDREAAADLLPLVYRQFRAQAQQQLMNKRQSHTLQATALMHEAYIKLVGNKTPRFAGRAHFYAAAA